jgi:hypothetical protein
MVGQTYNRNHNARCSVDKGGRARVVTPGRVTGGFANAANRTSPPPWNKRRSDDRPGCKIARCKMTQTDGTCVHGWVCWAMGELAPCRFHHASAVRPKYEEEKLKHKQR